MPHPFDRCRVPRGGSGVFGRISEHRTTRDPASLPNRNCGNPAGLLPTRYGNKSQALAMPLLLPLDPYDRGGQRVDLSHRDRKRAKRVACCLGSRSRGIAPATSGFDSLESRDGIFARRPVAMQEGIDRQIAHQSPACASQTRRKRHMCFGHESAATCWSSHPSRTTMTLHGAWRRPGSVRWRRTLRSTRAARLPQERGPISPRILLFAPKVGGNKGRQCSGR